MLSGGLAGLPVLVVEDEPLIAMAHAHMLEADCAVLECVATADAGVSSSLRHAPDFVLMDDG